MKIDRYISYLIAAVLVIAVIGVIYIMANPSPSEKFTEFYILGSDGMAGNYPTNLSMGESGTVIIGTVNHEGAPENYLVTVKLNNYTLKEESFKLQINESKEINFTFNANQTGNNQKMEFYLYKMPDTQNAYRFLELIINVD